MVASVSPALNPEGSQLIRGQGLGLSRSRRSQGRKADRPVSAQPPAKSVALPMLSARHPGASMGMVPTGAALRRGGKTQGGFFCSFIVDMDQQCIDIYLLIDIHCVFWKCLQAGKRGSLLGTDTKAHIKISLLDQAQNPLVQLPNSQNGPSDTSGGTQDGKRAAPCCHSLHLASMDTSHCL